MNGQKQFHPWPTEVGTKPLVAAAFDTIADHCDQLVVVLGHRAEEVAEVLRPRRFRAVLADPDSPMFSSIKVGLEAALELEPSAPILLQPADHPEVSPSTLDQLLKHAEECPDQAIIPEHLGRGGHPVLIPASIARLLLKEECPDGLGHYWAAHPEQSVRVAVDDSNTTKDIDRPDSAV